MPPPFSARTPEQNLGLVLRVGLVALFAWVTRSLLIPVAMGALLAILLHPLSERLSRRFKHLRPWAPLIITVGGIVLVVMPMILIIIRAFFTVDLLVEGDFLGSAGDFLSSFLAQVTRWGRELNLGWQNMRDLTAEAKPKVATAIAGFLSNTVSALPTYIVELFLFVISLYYLLRDGPKVVAWLRGLSPYSERATNELFTSISDTVHGALLGTMAVAVVQGGLTLVALLAFQVPGAFLWGVLATAFSFIPMFGTAPVTGGAVLYLSLEGRTGAAVGMAVIAVVIGLSDNVIQPMIQSSRSKMHPLLALLSLFGGLTVFGPFGVFIGPVSAAMAVWSLKTFRAPPPRSVEGAA